MNLVDKIRDLSQYVEPKDIAETLDIPENIVIGILNKTLDPNILDNPKAEIKIITEDGYEMAVFDTEYIITDAASIKAEHKEATIILTGIVTDWITKQPPRPQFINFLEEAVSLLKENSLKEEIGHEKTYEPKDRLLVLSYANKGGVGKTTTAISLAETLSTRVKTLLCDFNYTGPSIGAFYSVKTNNYLKGPVRPIKIKDNLYVLPAPEENIPSCSIKGKQICNMIDTLNFQVVVGDTPPGPWDLPYLHDLFARSDLVYSVVDQSLFSVNETKRFGITLAAMGVTPDKVRIIINRYSLRQVSPQKILDAFCSGFKKTSRKFPKIVAHIPEAWEEQVKAGYKGIILNKNIWEDVCSEIHVRLGLESNFEQKSFFKSLQGG